MINAQRPVWLSPDSGSLTDFIKTVGQTTDPAAVPNARTINTNVPIYHAHDVRDLKDTALRDIMAEWVSVFMNGPGIIVLEQAMPAEVVDRATRLFADMINAEKSAGGVASDHFAAAGSNDRLWNSLEKQCIADPEGFALYYGNPVVAAVCTAWLGRGYQMTAQVNRVNPGGKAQQAHRDYHLGFMEPEKVVKYPSHVHALSPVLTLQGALIHCDMPVESGPTMYLPFSQQFFEGYLAFERPEFQKYFQDHHVQLPLKKGDAVFFNPALMHGAGNNTSKDILRTANLVQVSSPFGRALEAVDRTRMCCTLYPVLQNMRASGQLNDDAVDALIAATAEGYAFPTNLDRDPPRGGLSPKTQQQHMREALDSDMAPSEFSELMAELAAKHLTS